MESKTIRHTASMLMTATIILLCIPEAAGLFVFGFGIAGLPYLVLVALIFFGTWALADHQGRALIQLRNAQHASGRDIERTRDVAFRAVAEAFDLDLQKLTADDLASYGGLQVVLDRCKRLNRSIRRPLGKLCLSFLLEGLAERTGRRFG